MREVVDEILAAEKKVEEIISSARHRAAQIRQEIDKEAVDIVTTAHEESKRVLGETVEAARRDAEKTRDLALSRADEELARYMAQAGKNIDPLVSEISRIVAGPYPQEEHGA